MDLEYSTLKTFQTKTANQYSIIITVSLVSYSFLQEDSSDTWG